MIILTGGAGFIGSCYLRKLNDEGIKDIIVVDHLDSDLKKQNLVSKIYTDYFDKDDFLKKLDTLKNVEAVFHIGACSSTMETDEKYLLKNNYEYSKTLAEWALKNNARFFYASSAATYGDGSLGYSDDDSLSLKLKPLNLYGKSKQMFDKWVLDNKLQNKVVGFKYFNVFGPNEYHKEEMRSLIVKAYEQIKREGKIKLFRSYKKEYKDGEQKRDFVYIKDVVDLMHRFYLDKNVKGIYNIGSGEASTWNELARAIFSALRMEPKIEYINMPEKIKDKYQYFTQADLSKLKKTGLKVSFRTLEASVDDYVNNHLEKAFKIL